MNNRDMLGGVALGAGLAFLFDPDRGARRRALLRDKGVRLSRTTRDVAEAVAEDARNRFCGVVAELDRTWQPGQVSDDVLVARVRSRLGRAVSHPHAIDVAATNGIVTLRGPICAGEVPAALRAAARTRGVCDVVNEFEPHADGSHIPSLQGSGRKPSWTRGWSPTALAAVGLTAMAVAGVVASKKF